jgi:hypothetical protein
MSGLFEKYLPVLITCISVDLDLIALFKFSFSKLGNKLKHKICTNMQVIWWDAQKNQELKRVIDLSLFFFN